MNKTNKQSENQNQNPSQNPSQNQSHIQSIIFDLGGVLIDWDPRYLYRQLFQDDPVGMENFLNEVCTADWNAEQDAGRSFREAVDELRAQHPQWSSLIEAYHQRWPEMLGGELKGSVDILYKLKQNKWPLHALTNWSAETFPIACERFPFLEWFDSITVSGVEKLRKPDPRFFQIMLRRTQIDPTTALFIDDVPVNIDAASRLGFETHLFISPEELGKELAKRKILLD